MRAAIVLGAAAYIGYLALLITCDLRRVESLGFSPAFESGAVLVTRLDPGSAGAGAGLANGDRLLRANGQILEGPVDWQRVRAHLDPAVPFELGIERGATTSTVTMQLRAGLTDLRSVLRRPALLGFRLAQVITLTLALVVAFRRSFQSAALAGALLLASIATVSLVLPMRMAVFWHALPAPASLLLWIPFATSVAAGPLTFVFAAVFPRRSWSTRALTIALLPAALVVGWHVFVGYQIMADPGAATGLPDSITITAVVNAAYGVLGIAVMVAHRSVAETPTDRRRIGVLIVGQLVGACAGVGVIVGYWREPGGDIFASPTMTVLSLVFLAVPASFAYAILRHRLFDVSLIVRQGIRYAMTRRFIDALIPALGALVLADVYVNRDQPVRVMIESRWWWFVLIGIALMVVRSRRDEWLKRVDRRFFRERYDAHRLLTSIAEQTARAASFDATAPAIVQQIDEALRPTFVTLLRYVPAESAFNSVSSASALEQTPRSLPASLSVIGVVAVLRKPLALSLGDTAWVRHQLPIEERSLLLDQGIELLVPMPGGTAGELPLGLLALGPRRSEQPYDQQDLDLLVTIAAAVGVLLERTTEEARGVAECETCGRCFDSGVRVCAIDGHTLAAVRGSRLLNSRYRLERRLGRGGMGVVYAARDVVLEREVAVKVIRDEIVGPLNLASRFRGEARAAASFAHPHVVRVYDFGVGRGEQAFLVMELLEGMTLRQRLASGSPMLADEALHILRGVCSALSAAHDLGIVHRDLKPENIFLHRHATALVPKVLDFGLAKAFDTRALTDGSTALDSSAGLLVGTVEYMAPEQAAGDSVSPAWDVWAVAVIAYEMLTGSHPFRGPRVDRAASANGLGSGALVLSDAARTFFKDALSTERSIRPPGAREFLAAYERSVS